MAALLLDGTTGNYASAPDTAALSITSDITLLCRVALDDWTPGTPNALISKYTTTGNQLSYSFIITATGQPSLRLSANGSTSVLATASVAPTITDGAALWVLVSWRNSDDRVQFFTASGSIADPVASDFSILGANQSAAATGIFDSTAVLEIGARDVGTTFPAAGKFYRAKIYNGVFSTAAFGGTLQFDAKFMDVVKTGTRTPASFTESSANAATVTLNGSAWDWYVISATLAATLGSLTGAVAATPDHPATLASALGSLTSAVTATPDHPAVLTANLGSLVASLSATVEHPVFASDLGALVAAVAADVTHDATLSAPLGDLVAAFTASVTHDATFAALLGELAAAVTAAPDRAATLASDLDGLIAAVTAIPTHAGVFTANLGSLVATLVATARAKIFRPPTRPNIAYQAPRGESAAARALSRHLAVTVEGINVFILTDDTVTTTRPDDATTIRRTLWGGHEEPVDNDETALLTAAGYGGYITS